MNTYKLRNWITSTQNQKTKDCRKVSPKIEKGQKNSQESVKVK